MILDRFAAMINIGDSRCRTPALICAEMGHVQLLQFLVSRGADLSISDDCGRNCLHLACAKGYVSVVKYLLSENTDAFDINSRVGIYHQTPVILAAAEGHYDVFHLLLSEGADLSLTDIYNRDCLISACHGGNVSIVKHLLSLKTFDINKRENKYNQTPVMRAASHGHHDVFNLLVSEGADLSLTDDDSWDCLMLACWGGNAHIVQSILSLKLFDINRRDKSFCQTPVMMAAERGHFDVFHLLVSEGADLSLTDEQNRDCLMLACHGSNVSIVKRLLSLKTFDVNKKGGYFNETPVDMAAKIDNKDIYNLLVSHKNDM